jgi:hypothetical protein
MVKQAQSRVDSGLAVEADLLRGQVYLASARQQQIQAQGQEELAHWVNPNWLWFTAFVGANLFQSSLTRWCLMEDILHKIGIAKKASS